MDLLQGLSLLHQRPGKARVFSAFVKYLELTGFFERVRRPLISLFSALGNELETSGWIHLIGSWVGGLGLVSSPWMAAAASRQPPFGGNKTHLSQIKTGAAPGRC